MREGVNASPCTPICEVAASAVPGLGIQYLNWAGITASWEEVLAALLLVDTFGLTLHTIRNRRFVMLVFCFFVLQKGIRRVRYKTRYSF